MHFIRQSFWVKRVHIRKRYFAVFAFLLTAAILSTFLFPAGKADAAASVKPRFQIPYKGESGYGYYYSDKNIFYQAGYGMPNCTAYAYGRAYELLGKAPNLCPYDAFEWYDYNKKHGYYAYGQTPKIGAIACWNNSGGGHVAVVEAITNDKIIMSQSGYGYLEFYLSWEDIDDPGQTGWTFQGYIYPGEFTSSGFDGDLYRSVDYTGSLNFRSGPGTDYSVIDTLDYHMGFIVTDKTVRGGYTWGHTTYKGKSGYIALTGDVQYLYSSSSQENPDDPAPEVLKHYYIITSDDGVNLRSGAGTSYQRIGLIPYEAQILVTRTMTAGGYTWGYTSYRGQAGWCVLDYAERIFCSGDGTKLPVYRSYTGICGDVDGDGKVTISDVTAIQLYKSGSACFTQKAWDCADTDLSGNISILDATNIQLYLVGQFSSLPVKG